MYGGDWPVAELAKYTDWIGVLDWATAGCTPEEKRKLFRGGQRNSGLSAVAQLTGGGDCRVTCLPVQMGGKSLSPKAIRNEVTIACIGQHRRRQGPGR
jgi:hypothetical protein